jgi:uncharacterized protein YndB with AHSA1/START domain
MIAAANEITMSRVFDAPRELVFDMWTNPDHVAWWFGPRGFSMTIESMDVRPGGAWKFVMHGPDGRNYDNHIVYRVVDRPSRLCYSHVAPKFDVEITFEDLGGKTQINNRMIFDTAETRDRIAKEYGAIEGLEQTLSRLAIVAEGMTTAMMPNTEFVATRVFDAPRELVFRAYTDPEMMLRWWGPHRTKNLTCEVDLRVGGTWRVKQESDGQIHDFSGTYLEIDAPERFVQTFIWAGAPDRLLTSSSTFDEEDGKTRLTAVIRFDSLETRDGMLSTGMIGGMMHCNERLDVLFAEEQSRKSS